PKYMDFTHGNYVRMDGVYHSYLLIPSSGYRTHVFSAAEQGFVCWLLFYTLLTASLLQLVSVCFGKGDADEA
ncbi:MAG: hypothetical protein IKV55_00310, partial [Oscillospiraceae bacterium]|nr:hypothetical protein [Oscillospiraceae bacterium]